MGLLLCSVSVHLSLLVPPDLTHRLARWSSLGM